jgi:methionine-S-sulfoxide reductase
MQERFTNRGIVLGFEAMKAILLTLFGAALISVPVARAVTDPPPSPPAKPVQLSPANSLRTMSTNSISNSSTNSKTASVENKDSAQRETATFAGGCFWGMEEILRKIPGVLGTSVGYTGGHVANPGYRLVCTGTTGHAEAVQIIFDPRKITYEELLGYFFRMHDPTTLNQQHNDIGTQYRSAIFYHGDEQRKTAERVKDRVNKSGKWPKPIVTEITAAKEFYSAEDYHQKYLVKNPGGYNCHVLRD